MAFSIYHLMSLQPCLGLGRRSRDLGCSMEEESESDPFCQGLFPFCLIR